MCLGGAAAAERFQGKDGTRKLVFKLMGGRGEVRVVHALLCWLADREGSVEGWWWFDRVEGCLSGWHMLL